MAAKVEKKSNKLMKLCSLSRHISKQTGREYFSGSFSFGTKLLILEDRDARAGEPRWNLYLTEREQGPVSCSDQQGLSQKQVNLPLGQIDDIPDPGWPTRKSAKGMTRDEVFALPAVQEFLATRAPGSGIARALFVTAFWNTIQPGGVFCTESIVRRHLDRLSRGGQVKIIMVGVDSWQRYVLEVV